MDSSPSNSIKLVFLRLFRCSAVITMASLQWLLLVSEEQGELMAREMDFRKPRLRVTHGRFELVVFFFVSIRQRFRIVHAIGNRSAQEMS